MRLETYLLLVRPEDESEPVHGDGDDGEGAHEGGNTRNGTNQTMVNTSLKKKHIKSSFDICTGKKVQTGQMGRLC